MSGLDEIKQTINENGIYIKTGTQMNIDILEDVYEDYEDEINLVIQQAERVEDLKKEKQHYKDVASQLVGEEVMHEDGTYQTEMQKLEKQNQRYKQALDKILCTDDFEDAVEYAEKVIDIVTQALKEGEDE